VKAGHVAGRAWTVDIAPTIATAIGAALPADLDGRPLDLTREAVKK
jgi:arylsulfatase A-like enzyme